MSAFLDGTITPYCWDLYEYVPWEVYTLGLFTNFFSVHMGTRWLLTVNMDSELNYNFPIENKF